MIKKDKRHLTKEERIIEQRKELAKNGKVAAIWTRVSTADQFRTNYSIETQIPACREYCRKNNIRIKKEFGGKNESAKEAGDLFLDMIGEVLNDPEYNCIVVFDFDRFSRSSDDGIIYKTKVKRSGITVKSVNQSIGEDNILGEQIENILIIIADIDNAMRRHKCHSGMVSCVQRGELYSRPPFGYDSKKVDRTHVITVNEDGRILKNAFDWIANEPEISQAEVRRRLSVMGLEISKQKLSQCLHNCFYCGILEHKYLEKPIKGVQEPLVSEELFNRVQDILNGNFKGYLHSEETPKFPLKQHIYCAKDKHALSGYTVRKKGIDYYKCSVKGCGTNVSAKEVHRQYSSILNSIAIPKDYHPMIERVLKRKFEEKEGQEVQTANQIRTTISKLETKLRNAKMKFLTEDGVSECDYNEVRQDLDNRITQCRKELEKVENKTSNLSNYISKSFEIASSLGSAWDKMNFEACQKIQKLAFPGGVLWDNETRRLRTEGMNEFFSKFILLRTSVAGGGKKKTDKSYDLSVLVAGGGLEPPTSGL